LETDRKNKKDCPELWAGEGKDLSKKSRCLSQKEFDRLDPELVQVVVGRIEEVLPLPTVVNALLKAANDPYISLAQIADTILKDQALTAKVLKIINSAYYGLTHQIVTITQAVNLLGLEKIKNLAMAISLADRLYHYSGLPFGRRGLWQHAQACGVATLLLAQSSGYPLPEEALIAGLLHDIAKALWAEVFPERLLAALQAMSAEGVEPLQAEKDFLALDHPTLGALMMEKWHLPEVFREALLHHHQNEAELREPRSRLLCQCLYVGNLLAKLLNLGNGGHYRLSPLPAKLLQDLQVSRPQLAALLRKLPQAYGEFVRELELEGGEPQHLPALMAVLRARPVLVWREGEVSGAASLFFEAFAPQVKELTLQSWAEAVSSTGAVIFWEGLDPAPMLARWQQTQPHPQAWLLLYSHRPWSPHDLPLPASGGIHLLGPDWHLEEVTKFLSRQS